MILIKRGMDSHLLRIKWLNHLIFALLVALFIPTSDINAQPWKLIWSDDFNYQGLPDKSKWSYEKGYVRNGEKQFYTVSELKNARVEGGYLIIEAYKHIQKTFIDDVFDKQSVVYSSASLITKDIAQWKYGRIEVRAKLPQGRGVWPAIWLLGTDSSKGWPRLGEIDIMEYVGYQPHIIYAAIHTMNKNHQKGNGVGGKLTVDDLDSAFHTYAVDRYPDRLDFWFDDKRYFSYQKESDDYNAWPFDDPMYLIINLAIGGGWGGQKGIDESIFPQKFIIDYVRVYQSL